MNRCTLLGVAATAAAFALAGPAGAQGFNNPWLALDPAPPPVTAVALSENDTEGHFAVGDLDQDGWTDVVPVRTTRQRSISTRTAISTCSSPGAPASTSG